MGRQVNFYMTENDECKFATFVKESGGVFLSLRQSSPGRPKALDSLPSLSEPFANEISIAREIDARVITTNSFPLAGYWFLDENNDCLVQFRRSIVTEDQIQRGRLWIETSRSIWDASSQTESLIRKEEAFVRFYDLLATWLRKHFKRCHNGFWCGHGALNKSKAGVRLV